MDWQYQSINPFAANRNEKSCANTNWLFFSELDTKSVLPDVERGISSYQSSKLFLALDARLFYIFSAGDLTVTL